MSALSGPPPTSEADRRGGIANDGSSRAGDQEPDGDRGIDVRADQGADQNTVLRTSGRVVYRGLVLAAAVTGSPRAGWGRAQGSASLRALGACTTAASL